MKPQRGHRRFSPLERVAFGTLVVGALVSHLAALSCSLQWHGRAAMERPWRIVGWEQRRLERQPQQVRGHAIELTLRSPQAQGFRLLPDGERYNAWGFRIGQDAFAVPPGHR